MNLQIRLVGGCCCCCGCGCGCCCCCERIWRNLTKFCYLRSSSAAGAAAFRALLFCAAAVRSLATSTTSNLCERNSSCPSLRFARPTRNQIARFARAQPLGQRPKLNAQETPDTTKQEHKSLNLMITMTSCSCGGRRLSETCSKRAAAQLSVSSAQHFPAKNAFFQIGKWHYSLSRGKAEEKANSLGAI